MRHEQLERLAVIVFVDIVGFSKYLSYKQENLITSLNAELSRELFQLLGPVGAEPRLICLPTGDGVALVFVGGCEDNELFSLLHGLIEWTRAVSVRERLDREQPCRIRVGVHAGSVSLITDLNRRQNVCGDDINTCRRIMDQAWPNQVLFSEAAYDRFVRGDRVYTEFPFAADRPAKFSDLHRVTAKHDKVLEVRVMYRDGSDDWDSRPPKSVPRVIDGPRAAFERTELINSLLPALAHRHQERVTVYEQASYSTFSITQTMEPDYDRDLVQLCVLQLALLEELMRRKETTVRVFLRPFLAAPPGQARALDRIRALAGWMDANLDGEVYHPAGGAATASRVQFREAGAGDAEFWQAGGPNVFVIRDHVRIDGYRVRDKVSHGLSLVYYEEHEIKKATAYFDREFERRKGQTNRDIRVRLQQLLDTAGGKTRAPAARRNGTPAGRGS